MMDMSVIEDSDESFAAPCVRRIVVSSTEDEEDDEEAVSPVLRRRQLAGATRPLRISDSSDEDDEETGRLMSPVTRMSVLGIRNVEESSDDDSDNSDFVKSDDVEPLRIEVSSSSSEEEDEIDEDVVMLSPRPVRGIEKTDVVDLTINEKSPTKVDLTIDEKYPTKVDLTMEEKYPMNVDLTVEEKFTMKVDLTYPNAGVVFVSRQARQNELEKLESLRRDRCKVKLLVQNMHVDNLPDGGAKLTRRYVDLENEVKRQAEKVAKMVVDSESPPKNLWKEPISWKDLKEGSNAVKPKMHGSQALNTHSLQRALTLERLQALHNSLDMKPAEDSATDSPRSLVTQLMAHQKRALSWLIWRETQSPRGGILADDMGLGKSLTMISLILHSKENNLESNDENDREWNDKSEGKRFAGGTLVVCPASLLSQWEEEIKRHCKKHTLKTIIHHGNNRETKAHRLISQDVIITTYNIVQRDFQKNGVLMHIFWRRVILDEAHIVRNHKSLTAQAVFNLNAKYRWCLTGTPVHNKDFDLFSLLKFLQCSPFDDIVLWKKWIENKTTGGQERLATILKSLLLRRTKQQLQEEKAQFSLPEKSIHQIDVTMSKDEMTVYKKILLFSRTLLKQYLHQRSGRFGNHDEMRREKLQEAHSNIIKKLGGNRGEKIKTHQILVVLLRLRQICCHPGLINAMLDDDQNIGELDNTIAALNEEDQEMDILNELSQLNISVADDDEDHHQRSEAQASRLVLHKSNPVFNLERQSSKIQAVLKCLQDNVFNENEDKAIVVSQWTSVLELIKHNLNSFNIKNSTLSGKIPVKDRQQIVRDFNDKNSGIQVLLLSLCAGGVGLNLVGANHLLLTDLHWNPQLETQAQDRIYRVGQVKPVKVYKFICKNTIECIIQDIQEKKLGIAENVLTGARRIHSSKLSIEDLKLMFGLSQ